MRLSPAFARWAKFCRTSGACESSGSFGLKEVVLREETFLLVTSGDTSPLKGALGGFNQAYPQLPLWATVLRPLPWAFDRANDVGYTGC